MGLASGGMLALALMAPRRQSLNFSIILGLTVLLALLGVASLMASVESLTVGLSNAAVLLILSFALGYSLTTFSALSPAAGRPRVRAREPSANWTAVVLLAQGEPPEYTTYSAAKRFELADDAQDVPPILLRPFYMRDLRRKYRTIGRSPARTYYDELARKVEARLDGSHKVFAAFYSDNPTLAEVANEIIERGAQEILVVHLRVSNPPKLVLAGDLLDTMHLARYAVTVNYIGPLTDAGLLPQIYVRRVVEAIPQVAASPDEIGLLLLGRGHGAGDTASTERQKQEQRFQANVVEALLQLGFSESHIVLGWLRARPSSSEAITALAEAGCKVVYCIPSTFAADGITTLHDIPAQIETVAHAAGIKLIYLPAWNADDLAAEEIANYVRAYAHASRAAVGLAI